MPAQAQETRIYAEYLANMSAAETIDYHAISLVEQTGSIQETMRRARAYADMAKDALTVLPASEIRSALSDIADFCVERAY